MRRGQRMVIGLALAALPLAAHAAPATAIPETPLALSASDVIPTASDWIALPDIRAGDGALGSFNVLSARYRGLLEAAGPHGEPLLKPFLVVDGAARPLAGLKWTLQGYWIPTGTMTANGLEAAITFVALPRYRAALVRLRLTNRGAAPVNAGMGVDLGWGAMNRVTYTPVALTGTRTMKPAPWDRDMQVFGYGVDDAQVSWALSYAGMTGALRPDPATPGLSAQKTALLAPGQTLDLHVTLSAGIEEYGTTKTITVVDKAIDRIGLDALIAEAATEALRHTRTTGDPLLDRVMNRNYLFTSYFAWGRTIDTEALVGVTSRSNRYYVSAAYWDRDAMLWSFPGLLDTDPARAREALDHALGVQGRNAGVHSRYIDGVVLEDGFELDELAAPLLALAAYSRATGDLTLLAEHRARVAALRAQLLGLRDPATGLYPTFQDAQDEYVKKPFSVYDNVIVWRTLLDLAALDERTGDRAAAADLQTRAAALKAAILRYGVASGAPGADGPIFAATVDGHGADFADVPPGSLLKLPLLGFIAEDDPLFRRTYAWLHSRHHRWSFAGAPYGLPGSYRLPFTTSWVVADELRLRQGSAQALKVLRESPWDGGIVTEGVSPATGVPDRAGRAFATAAGYVAHAICLVACRTPPLAPPPPPPPAQASLPAR